MCHLALSSQQCSSAGFGMALLKKRLNSGPGFTSLVVVNPLTHLRFCSQIFFSLASWSLLSSPCSRFNPICCASQVFHSPKNILLFNFTGAFKCKCHDGNLVLCSQIFTNHARMFLLYKTYFVFVFLFCIKHIPSEPRTQRPVFTSRQEMHKRAALGNACRWVTQSVSDWYFSDFQIINVNQLRWMITDDNYYHGL